MAKYRITKGQDTCAVVEEGSGLVTKFNEINFREMGMSWEVLRRNFEKDGCKIIPVIEQQHPESFEFRGVRYFLSWHGNKLLRIIKHDENGVEEITWKEFPEQLKGLL